MTNAHKLQSKVQVIRNTAYRPSTQVSYTIGSGTTMQENQLVGSEIDGLGASYHIKQKMNRACVPIVLTYGTETRAMKAGNLHSLEKTESMYDGEVNVWSVLVVA